MRHNQDPKMSDSATETEPAAFLAESTLGKLAKWLRLAGLDTRLDRSRPNPNRLKQIAASEQRVILTRTQAVLRNTQPHQCLFIQFNHPMDQARQVVTHFRIRKSALRTLSRCALCNRMLERLSPEAVYDRVPAYIWQTHDRFMMCPRCQHIYWPGTHADRMLSCIDQWF
jgi:uncharacterized protein with PIN domain